MTTDLHSRAVSLVVLAVLGVGLAVVGTTVGTPDPPARTGSSATFVVSDRNVTVERGDRQATVVDDMSGVRHVEIERQGDGVFQVTTETEQPVTDRERRRATAIARSNATVQRILEDLGRYELAVEPIRVLAADSARTTNVTLDEPASDGETYRGNTADPFSVETEDGTVTVDRDPTYVEDEVGVRIRDPAADGTIASVTVDLENGTVSRITDWTPA